MLLYIHVPFCRQKCRYCGFYSKPPAEGEIKDFVDRVVAEARFWRESLERASISTVYIGGGTPSLLPINLVERLVGAVNDSFSLARGLEFTFEANPDSVSDQGYLKNLRDLGVNRLSLGVQSFRDEELRFLGRPHTAEQAVLAYGLAKEVGFANINMDLIWGLPGQDARAWTANLRRATKLGPQHLSCYGLTVEPDTPLQKQALENPQLMPDDETQAGLFIKGSEFLESMGYLHYEISSFARMGFVCRHNTGYWEGEDYLGLGPAAVSTIAGRRWENPKDARVYGAAVKNRRIGANAKKLTHREKVVELVMLSLRTARGLRLKDYSALTGKSFVRGHSGLVQALRKADLVRLSKDYFRLTKQGMLVSNSILVGLLSGLPESEQPD